MSIELKIKAKSLAAEARFIRKEEQKLKGHYHRGMAAGYTEEAPKHLYTLRDVREEARQTHLARAFLKGTPYRKVETNRHAEIARRYAKHKNATIPYSFEKTAKMLRLYGPKDLCDLNVARAAVMDRVTADG